MRPGNTILAFRGAARHVALDDKAAQVVAECRKVVERALPKLINGLFEKLDDSLYELADKSESNQLQSSYFGAMRSMRKHRARIQSDFSGGVLEDFDNFWKNGPRSLAPEQWGQAEDDLDLSLVDEEELEQSLAVSNLVSKGENRYHRELYALSQRFGHLAGGIEVEVQSNPLGPAGVCGRFHHALRGLNVDTPVLLVIYKLFDKQVMNYVGGLYEEINSLVGRSGKIPKPAQRINRGQPAPRGGVSTPVTARARGMQPGESGAGPQQGRRPPAASVQPSYSADPSYGAPVGYIAPGGYAAEGEDFEAELFHTLQGLLGNYRSRIGVGVARPPPAQQLPIVGTSELLNTLSSLQHSNLEYLHSGNDARPTQVDLRNHLKDELQLEQDGEASRALGKADEDTLDVISMLFEFLLDDPNLPDAMKALLARLQIPMLKVAIMDKTFFSRKLHPARRLLNSLARAAMGWSDDGDRAENSLYGHIETIVNRIVAGFGDDPLLFDELNEGFAAYMEREQRGADIAEERTNQVTRGKEQLRLAKTMVAEEIERRLRHHPGLPLVVQTLLEDGWKDVLLLSYLRQGPESGSWTENLRVTDRLLWSVEPKSEYAERQELLRAIPDLLRQLREGLNGISYDQHKMARIFKELQACHIACLRTGGRSGPAAAPAEKTEAPDARKAAADRQTDRNTGAESEDDGRDIQLPMDSGSDEIQHDRFTEMAENLGVGTWLELREEDGRQVRIKLSWKGDVSDVYVFVNRKGVKVLEMTRVGVARLFRSQSAEVLQDVNVPIMDRALGAMLETLKTTEGAKG